MLVQLENVFYTWSHPIVIYLKMFQMNTAFRKTSPYETDHKTYRNYDSRHSKNAIDWLFKNNNLDIIFVTSAFFICKHSPIFFGKFEVNSQLVFLKIFFFEYVCKDKSMVKQSFPKH